MYQKSMFEAKCNDCGNVAMVPFKPAPGKPVFCKTCFPKHRAQRIESTGSNNAGFAQKQVWARRRDSESKF